MGGHGEEAVRGGAVGERQIAGRVIRRGGGGKKSRVDQTESTKLDAAPSSPTKQRSEDGVDVGVLLGQSNLSFLTHQI